MRCFVAIDLPQDIINELQRVQLELSRADAGMKLVAPEKVHLTIAFLGEVDSMEVENCKAALNSVKCNSFRARLGNVGFFSPEYIRIIFVELEPANEFINLNKLVYSELSKFCRLDNRFHPHITLARVKSIGDRARFLEVAKDTKVKPLEFNVKSFSLKKSSLRDGEYVYEDLAGFTLT